jgi:UDP-N-acetyl-D-galactosamine dehydrogenase
VHGLQAYGVKVDIYDPWVSREEARHEYGLELLEEPRPGTYDAMLVAVAHRQFVEWGAETLRSFGKSRHVLYDLKYVLPQEASDLRL